MAIMIDDPSAAEYVSAVLKTNDSLQFAVMTGCLRVAKESIFTGLNNLKVLSLTTVSFDEYFGFTDSEVRELLAYYRLEDKYENIKNWYDGYHFGNVDVYCPWDVLNYCDELLGDPRCGTEELLGRTPAATRRCGISLKIWMPAGKRRDRRIAVRRNGDEGDS